MYIINFNQNDLVKYMKKAIPIEKGAASVYNQIIIIKHERKCLF